MPKDTTIFGFMYDYAELNKLYISDAAKIEVYGEPDPVNTLGSYLAPPVVTKTSVDNTAFSSYVFDYAQSTLSVTKTDVLNTSFMQNQP
ncbi:hypothetical protein D3C80_883800 [compost metagenome]